MVPVTAARRAAEALRLARAAALREATRDVSWTTLHPLPPFSVQPACYLPLAVFSSDSATRLGALHSAFHVPDPHKAVAMLMVATL